ncbi:MAG: response regulator [Acidobacteria bacterium]|nr:response regulator [Acidobacteriota bacterium]
MGKRVLIVDDAMFTRTLISDILAKAGYEIAGEAGSGVEAIEKYKELSPDVVIMDLIMPDMGGIEAIKKIIAEDPKANIIVCSAMGQQALVVEAIEAGAKDFIVKPFQPAQILDTLSKVVK